MDITSTVFFSGWLPILRVVVVGTFGYIFLLFALRTVGPRTLARTNIFDFIILLSIGSAFGRILTAKDVALVEAFVAYALLVSMPYVVSLVRSRSERIASWLDADPLLLFYQGSYLRQAMRNARIREVDVEAAARAKGFGSMSQVEAIVLEAHGELSIIGRQADSSPLVDGIARQGRMNGNARRAGRSEKTAG